MTSKIFLFAVLCTVSLAGRASSQQFPNEPWTKVSHAGGVVQLAIPSDWNVEELLRGREVRLVAGPEVESGRQGRTGMWLAFQATVRLTNVQQIESLLEQRLADLAAEPSAPRHHLMVGGFEATRQYFTMSPNGSSATSSGAMLQGFHMLVDTTWGTLEFQVVAATVDFETQSRIWERILAGLRFVGPAAAPMQLGDEIRAAQPILGSWRAYRGQLRLSSEGRIQMRGDKPEVAGALLTGTFEARGDVLFVRWDDGSMLNYRWRREANYLLLTDHQGRTSQLKFVYD